MRMMINRNTSGGSRLAKELGVIRVRPDGNFRNNFNHTILNWGCTTVPQFPVERWINHPEAVKNAVDKVKCLTTLSCEMLPTVMWTTEKEEAESLQEDGYSIVARTLVESHSGKGIVLCSPSESLPEAKLYSVYIPRRMEYRVHVAFGKVIDVQLKRAREGAKEEGVLDYEIRNHAGGWNYTREGLKERPDRDRMAVLAVEVLGLDFGAVDIVRDTGKEDKPMYILEVNTAPGVYETTLANYKEAFDVV